MIPVKNIYHMLAYAFQVLREKGYESCGTEPFENTADLLAAILARGVGIQIKRGLNRAYLERTEPLSCLRGRLDMGESLRRQTMTRRQMVCTYDEFSVDDYLNRVLKTTMELLLRSDIPVARKRELRKLLVYFRTVGTLNVDSINWRFHFHRNNQSYQMLVSVCWLIIKGLLQTSADGGRRLTRFLDNQRMERLYERFLREYFRRHYPQLKANASQIAWALDDGNDALLPVMQTDILLTYGTRTLIIDAKCYNHMMLTHFQASTLRSQHLYQIFTYVKNRAAAGGEVEGMLLYAGTDEEIQPDNTYLMSGNRIRVKTLDLNRDFSEIAGELNAIADEMMMG